VVLCISRKPYLLFRADQAGRHQTISAKEIKNMHIWISLVFVMAGIVFGIDYLLRRKKWKENTKLEKASLIVNMFSVGPYIFLSVLGMLWGIASSSPETAFGQLLYDATLMMGGVYFIIAIAAVILSFVLRAKGKVKASIWIHIIAFLYIVAVLGANTLVGELL
jgi:hypothetical protein